MRSEIDAASAGVRLDAFVAQTCGVSLKRSRALIESGAVTLAVGSVAKGRRLQVGDVVVVQQGEVDEPVLQPHPEVALEVLYEDEFLIAINKPGPLASHPLRAGEGA